MNVLFKRYPARMLVAVADGFLVTFIFLMVLYFIQ